MFSKHPDEKPVLLMAIGGKGATSYELIAYPE